MTLELTSEAEAIVFEEEAILARARASLGKAIDAAGRARPAGDLRSIAALRALREEAIATATDDLPGVLHEMSVRQRLIEREAGPLPNPAAPYLAHLRVRERGGTKDYLLGHATFLDGAVRVVDWRVAPV